MAYKKDFHIENFQIVFSFIEEAECLNGFSRQDRVKGMHDGKDKKSIDMMFPFIAAFIDRAADHVENGPPAHVHTAKSKILCGLMFYKTAPFDTSGYWSVTRNHIQRIKEQTTSFWRM